MAVTLADIAKGSWIYDETRNRRALGFIYYSHRAKEDAAAHAAYQKKLAQEMAQTGRI